MKYCETYPVLMYYHFTVVVISTLYWYAFGYCHNLLQTESLYI